jgi:hypothetical protein
MIDMLLYPIWLVIGLLAGGVHATSLWRGTQRLTLWLPLVALARMAVVAGTFVVAALMGGILAAGLGWAVGFAAALAALLLGSRKP